MATVTIKDPITDSQARVINGVLQTSTGGGGGGGDVNLTEVGSSPISIGQALSAASLPVVLASDQSPVNVVIDGVNPNQHSVLIYNSQASVPVGMSTVVASYTAPAGPTVACLLLVCVGGQNVGQWVVANSSDGTYDQKYTSSANLNDTFSFATGSSIVPGQIIGAGNTITVSVNQVGNTAADFNARIQVLEIG